MSTLTSGLPMVMSWAGATGAWVAAVVCSTMASKQRSRAAINTTEVCQCEHGASYHDGAGCRYVIGKGRVTRYSVSGTPIEWEPAECTCVRYVGPNTSYLPEIDGPASPLNQLGSTDQRREL